MFAHRINAGDLPTMNALQQTAPVDSPPTVYDNNLKMRDALQSYFSRYHFVNGGYDLKWFKIKVGAVFIPLPNIKDRVAAVKIHDVHHVLKEYTATLEGEAEIGAWEIASGCGKYYVAWLLNFASFFYGLFFFPSSLLTAFLNGRRCKTNFYHSLPYDDHLLNRSVGDLRKMVGIEEQRKSTVKDYLCFIFWCLPVIAIPSFLLWVLFSF